MAWSFAAAFWLVFALISGIQALHHDNGTPLVHVYGPTDMRERGGAIAFNVCDRSGYPLAHSIVEERARHAGISIRGGCFCNPGASEYAFALDPLRTATCLEELGAAFTPERFAACSRTAVGASGPQSVWPTIGWMCDEPSMS